MELTKLANAIKELGRPRHGFNICIYGNPKVGKTRLAATIAKVPQIKTVWWVDVENGHETLITMYRLGILTEEEAAKIKIIRVQDTAERPLASETVLKMLTVNKDQYICEEHGKIACATCGPTSGILFNISKLGHDDVFVLDTGSAFGVSVLNFHMMGKPRDAKPGWDEYGPQIRDLDNALLIVQACKTNFIVLCHELSFDGIQTVYDKNTKEFKDIMFEEKYPMMGTKNFSKKCAKYFSHVIYMSIGLQKHQAGSASVYKNQVITGSRGGWQIEQQKNLSLATIFDELYNPKEEVQDTDKSTN